MILSLSISSYAIRLAPRYKNDAIVSPTKQGMDFVGLGKENTQVSTNAGGGVCDAALASPCLVCTWMVLRAVDPCLPLLWKVRRTDKKEGGCDALLAEKKGLKEGRGTARYARGIDKLVYKLYGLTEEEIAIVEGKK